MKNLIVPLLACIACAVIVSFTAVSVRYEQKLNQENEKKEKILAAAGIKTGNIDEEFSKIKTLFFSFETGDTNSPVSKLKKRVLILEIC